MQSITGFGFAMLAAPFVALVAPQMMPGPLLVLTLALTLGYAFRNLSHVAWADVGYILLGRLPLSALAAVTVAWLNPDLTGLIFGLFMCVSVVLSRRKVTVETTPLRLVIAGGLSGFFGTITSVAAPPLAIAYQSKPADILRASLAVNIVIGTGFSLIALNSAGVIDWADLLRQCAFCLPALVCGSWLGAKALKRYGQCDIRGAVLALAGLASFGLVLRSAAALLG